MLQILGLSFHNKIVFGAASAGGSGSGPSPGTVLSNGSMFLGTITLGAPDLDIGPGPGGGDGDEGTVILAGGGFGLDGSGAGDGTLDAGHYVLDLSGRDIEDVVAEGATTAINPPITLETVGDYIAENSAMIEAAYAVQENLMQSMVFDFSSNTAEVAKYHVEMMQIAGYAGSPASLWDFAVAENVEVYPGIWSDMEISLQISDAHLAARVLVEGGMPIAEAYMISNGHMLDEALVSDAAGQFAELDAINEAGVLYSSGIDVTGGLMVIEPNTDRLPTFAIPIPAGNESIQRYETDSLFYHDYDSSVSVPLSYEALRGAGGLAALEAALIANPTPGDDDAATINGTINDVGNLMPTDGDDNFVFSYVVDNPDENQSDIVVNYTVNDLYTPGMEHNLQDGYVARMVQRYDPTPDDPNNDDFYYTLVTFGEGDAFVQGVVEDLAELVADVEWYENAQEVFEAANDMMF